MMIYNSGQCIDWITKFHSNCGAELKLNIWGKSTDQSVVHFCYTTPTNGDPFTLLTYGVQGIPSQCSMLLFTGYQLNPGLGLNIALGRLKEMMWESMYKIASIGGYSTLLYTTEHHQTRQEQDLIDQKFTVSHENLNKRTNNRIKLWTKNV